MILTEHAVHTALLNSYWISGFRFAWWLVTFHCISGVMKIRWADSKMLSLSNLREKRLTTDQVKIRVFCVVTLCHWVISSGCFEGNAKPWIIGKYLQRVPRKFIHILRKEKNCIKGVMVLRSSNDNCASTNFFDYPACYMVMLAFIWIMPSFERMSYYILLL
jgi:hypothetical protein